MVHSHLSTTCTLVRDMANRSHYNVAKCCAEKSCPKCSSIGGAIVVNKGPHYTLYCAECGAYIKHASIDDKRHIYLANIEIEDSTPTKVCMLYVESHKTMITKMK